MPGGEGSLALAPRSLRRQAPWHPWSRVRPQLLAPRAAWGTSDALGAPTLPVKWNPTTCHIVAARGQGDDVLRAFKSPRKCPTQEVIASASDGDSGTGQIRGWEAWSGAGVGPAPSGAWTCCHPLPPGNPTISQLLHMALNALPCLCGICAASARHPLCVFTPYRPASAVGTRGEGHGGPCPRSTLYFSCSIQHGRWLIAERQ